MIDLIQSLAILTVAVSFALHLWWTR